MNYFAQRLRGAAKPRPKMSDEEGEYGDCYKEAKNAIKEKVNSRNAVVLSPDGTCEILPLPLDSLKRLALLQKAVGGNITLVKLTKKTRALQKDQELVGYVHEEGALLELSPNSLAMEFVDCAHWSLFGALFGPFVIASESLSDSEVAALEATAIAEEREALAQEAANEKFMNNLSVIMHLYHIVQDSYAIVLPPGGLEYKEIKVGVPTRNSTMEEHELFFKKYLGAPEDSFVRVEACDGLSPNVFIITHSKFKNDPDNYNPLAHELGADKDVMGPALLLFYPIERKKQRRE